MSTIPMNAPKADFVKDFFNMDKVEIYRCNIYNIKMFIFIIIMVVIFCCLASLINSIFFTPKNDDDYDENDCYEHLTMTGPLQYEEVIKNSYTRYDASE